MVSVKQHFWEDTSGAAVLLALLLHLLVALLILGDYLPHPQVAADPPAITVDLVQLPPPKPPEPPKAPEAAPPPEPPPEAVKPPPPPPPPPPPTPPARRPATPVTPPLKPQLQAGKLDKKSHAGGNEAADPPRQTIAPVTAAGAISLTTGPSPARHEGGGQATQSERDFILSQVLAARGRPFAEWGFDGIVHLGVEVLADGTLGPPFSKNMPYQPQTAIEHYLDYAQSDPRRGLLESLYLALRMAQPLRLPPELKAKAPFHTTLDFQLHDVP